MTLILRTNLLVQNFAGATWSYILGRGCYCRNNGNRQGTKNALSQNPLGLHPKSVMEGQTFGDLKAQFRSSLLSVLQVFRRYLPTLNTPKSRLHPGFVRS